MDLQLYRRTFLAGLLSQFGSYFVQSSQAVSAAMPSIRRDLPSLPLKVGAKVMGLGHSFVANSGYTVIYPGNPTPRIDIVTANWLGTIGPLRNVDNRFNLDCWYDPTVPTKAAVTGRMAGAIAGRGGEHIPQTLARLPWYIERAPDIVVLDIGTNDVASDKITLEDAIARYEALLKPLRDAGIWVVCMLPVDRIGHSVGAWPASDPRHVLSNGLADYIVSVDGRDGVKVVDDREVLSKAIAEGIAITEDDVHLNTVGQWLRYSVLLPILRKMVTEGDFYSRDVTLANLSPLGGFLGEKGKRFGVEGVVADSLVATRGGGQTDKITGSKEIVSDGLERQIFTIDPTDNANDSRVCTLTLSWPDMDLEKLGLSVGDWVEAGFDYELSESNDWLGLEFSLEANSRPAICRYAAVGGMVVRLNATQNGPRLTAPLSGRATIPRFRLLGSDDVAVPADYFRSSLRPIRLHWNKDSSDTLVAKFSPIIIRKSTDPRPAWNL